MHRDTHVRVARRRLMKTLGATALAALSLGVMPAAAQAQEWPSGSVQLVVPAKPGGGTDAAARVLAAALSEQTGGDFVVVNTPGGGGAVAAEQVRTAAPDGQQLLFYHTSLIATYHTGGYDQNPLEEFSLLAAMPVGGSYALAVGADAPYETMGDLMQAATDNPGKITLGVQIRGSSHFMAGLIEMGNDAKFRVVEAGSDADKLVQLQGGQIQAALINTPGTLQYVENGDLRILATISGQPDRDPNAPDYPSAAELGFENAVYGLDFLVFGPKGMDQGMAEQINAAFGAVLDDPEVSGQLEKMRFPVSHLGLAESRARTVDADKRLGATAKALGLSD
ncbi:tripartite tricarboxylate transporter substrate binding protein [Oceanicola sp. 502str15]|uniref:Bug family tripartite tricarboxylate transporter substrate binding protein n=1 Tax=Oceanicola sp. 502str15 TaxID=2696061 RepID=UPI002095591D|nr:tripartite tricarboxylate transporter substrate binding protein [Oceanicola sp. 502str15]MCO6384653.1 hypothetical protein [Oceanicola sp. 502str15]